MKQQTRGQKASKSASQKPAETPKLSPAAWFGIVLAVAIAAVVAVPNVLAEDADVPMEEAGIEIPVEAVEDEGFWSSLKQAAKCATGNCEALLAATSEDLHTLQKSLAAKQEELDAREIAISEAEEEVANGQISLSDERAMLARTVAGLMQCITTATAGVVDG